MRPAPRQARNNVEYGKELEDYIALQFIEIGFPRARRSKGSGNRGELGDISGQDFAVVEAKHRKTKNITIKADVWKKLKKQIPLHSHRIPMYVLQNQDSLRLVCVEVDDFFRIAKGYLHYLEDIGRGN